MSSDTGAAVQLGAILVVDDNEMNRDMLSRRLSRRGHAVVVAESGEQAIEMLETETIDIVLLDVMMPGIDGFETLARIRQKHDASTLPVIMATARGETEDIVRALEAGANDYVTKPLDFPVVLARTQTQLSLKFAMDEVRRLKHKLQDRNQELEAAIAQQLRDLAAAARVQQSCLPSDNVKFDRGAFAWRYLPCDELGGDGLNIMRLDDEHVALYILDVTGHGVPAALLSVSVSHNLSATDSQYSMVVDAQGDGMKNTAASPASVAAALNRAFPTLDQTEQFFTLIYGIYHQPTRTVRFASAGHPPVYHLPAGSNRPVQLPGRGIPIGIMDDVTYEERSLVLGVGDRLLMYSDGVYEAANTAAELFGFQRLEEAIVETAGMPIEQSIDELISRVNAWSAGASQTDDITLILLEVT